IGRAWCRGRGKISVVAVSFKKKKTNSSRRRCLQRLWAATRGTRWASARARETCPSRSLFFSSRRRHTRCVRDWSSDVCSSDLPEPSFFRRQPRPRPDLCCRNPTRRGQIGRASCRERGKISVVAVSLKKKTEAVRSGGRKSGGVKGTHRRESCRTLP